MSWAAYSQGKVAEAQSKEERLIAADPNSSHTNDAKLFLRMTAPTTVTLGRRATGGRTRLAGRSKPRAGAVFSSATSIAAQRIRCCHCRVYRSPESLPRSAPARSVLAWLYAKHREARRTNDLAMKARKTLPDDPELAQVLAELSYQRKDFAYAIQLLQNSSQKRPLDSKNLYYLGMSHFRAACQKAQSQKALRQALAAGLPDPLASTVGVF